MVQKWPWILSGSFSAQVVCPSLIRKELALIKLKEMWLVKEATQWRLQKWPWVEISILSVLHGGCDCCGLWRFPGLVYCSY